MSKRRTLSDRASAWSAKFTKKQPSSPNDWSIGYSWGAYDGFKAGFKAALRSRKKVQP